MDQLWRPRYILSQWFRSLVVSITLVLSVTLVLSAILICEGTLPGYAFCLQKRDFEIAITSFQDARKKNLFRNGSLNNFASMEDCIFISLTKAK